MHLMIEDGTLFHSLGVFMQSENALERQITRIQAKRINRDSFLILRCKE